MIKTVFLAEGAQRSRSVDLDCLVPPAFFHLMLNPTNLMLSSEYYDSTIDNELLFKEYNDALVYSDPIKDPAEVRDLIVLARGPDKGKTGIVIGIYADKSENNNCVVKLDKYRGMREIRVVPRSWVAKRLGEQDPDDVF